MTTFKPIETERLKGFSDRQLEIIEVAHQWGYFDAGLSAQPSRYRGRNVLDIGMGGGPHSVAFIVGGARSYVGVDPMVGTDLVSDMRALTDRSLPSAHRFPYSVAEIMEAFPNIRLYSALMEEIVPEVAIQGIDFIALSMVTEHLERPQDVIRSAFEVGGPEAAIWISHANYYSWTGHHWPPRNVQQWDPNNETQNRNVDWRHLNPDHDAYHSPNFNRMRMDDFRALVDKYFHIIQWRELYEATERLTPEIRQRWKRYTLSELLSRAVYVFGKKRRAPKETDIDGMQFWQPGESYRAGEDHSAESREAIERSNLVFLAKGRQIGSHSYNDMAGKKLMGTFARGDRITLQKFERTLCLWVEEVLAGSSVRFADKIAEDIYAEDRQEWTIMGRQVETGNQTATAEGGGLAPYSPGWPTLRAIDHDTQRP